MSSICRVAGPVSFFAEVATFHPDLLFDRAAGKPILRVAYADVLPQPILTRPKMGFGVPLADWLQTDLRSNVHDLLLSDSAPLGEILRRDRVRALVALLDELSQLPPG